MRCCFLLLGNAKKIMRAAFRSDGSVNKRLHHKAVPRFGEFCSCYCLPLPQLACSILATREQPYSEALYVYIRRVNSSHLPESSESWKWQWKTKSAQKADKIWPQPYRQFYFLILKKFPRIGHDNAGKVEKIHRSIPFQS